MKKGKNKKQKMRSELNREETIRPALIFHAKFKLNLKIVTGRRLTAIILPDKSVSVVCLPDGEKKLRISEQSNSS